MGRPIEKKYFGTVIPGGTQIAATAWIAGDTQARLGYIVKQVGSNRYIAANSYGEGACELVDNVTGPEQMSVQVASETFAGLEYAKKITDGEVYTWEGSYFPSWNPVNGQLVYGNPDIGSYWLATYGDIDTDSQTYFAQGLVHDNNGNMLVCGGNDNNAVLIKLNTTGSMIWQKQFSMSGQTVGECVAVDSNNNIYLVVQNWTSSKTTMLKIDSDGNILWQTELANSTNITDIAVSSNGTSAYACLNLDSRHGIIILNPNGSVKWQGKIEHAGFQYGWLGIGFVSESDLAVTTPYYNDGDSSYGLVIFRTDSNGLVIWTSGIDTSGETATNDNGVGTSLDTDSNGNIYTQSPQWFLDGSEGALYTKHNSSGTVAWQKTVKQNGSNFYPFALKAATDGTGIYSVGWSTALTIIGFDSTGEISWSNSLDSTGGLGLWYSYGTRDVSVTSNSVAVAGYQSLDGYGNTFQFAANLRRDGTGQGTYGTYDYTAIDVTSNAVSWSSGNVTVSLVSSNNTVTTGGFSVTDLAQELDVTNF